MSTVVRSRIIKIGNSQGIRIPKVLLEQANLGQEVQLELQEERIIIRPAGRPRDGWEAAFREMAERADDVLLDAADLVLTDWDREEWEW